MKHLLILAIGLAFVLTACPAPTSSLTSEDNSFAASEATTTKTGIATWTISLEGKRIQVRGVTGTQQARQTLEFTPGTGKAFSILRKFFDANGTQIGLFEVGADATGKPTAPTGVMNASLSPEVMKADLDQLVSSQALQPQLAAPPKMVRSPCQKAQNQAARAATAVSDFAAFYNSVCNAISFGPGCQDLFNQLVALQEQLAQAQQNVDQNCLVVGGI